MDWDSVFGVPHKRYKIRNDRKRIVRIVRQKPTDGCLSHNVNLEVLNDDCQWRVVLSCYVEQKHMELKEDVDKYSEDIAVDLKQYADYLFS